MRYLASEKPRLVAKFDTGNTVTINIYKLGTNGATLVVSGGSCTEIGSTGFFYYVLDVEPVDDFETYLWVMSNGSTTAYGTVDINGYAATPEMIAYAVWEEQKDNHTSLGTYGYILDKRISEVPTHLGIGTAYCTYNLTLSDNGLPISNARVVVSTDSTGMNLVASGVTDTYGNVGFYLDPGVVYMWRYKAGVNFVNPHKVEYTPNVTSASGNGSLVVRYGSRGYTYASP
ncbi:MAG TPA: hypothetical protein PK659_09030 [Methanothrix sp.]|nr:hypothetical protein [Methanothrix sp.]HOL44380.1 hypothetical protein [Methanothrix sp.]